jgi:hypothetical protein
MRLPIVSEKYMPLAIGILHVIWPGECGVGDRLLVTEYAGTPFAKTLPWRKRLVCFLVASYIAQQKQKARD